MCLSVRGWTNAWLQQYASRIERIDFSHNDIEEITNFQWCPFLSRLDLSFNRIESITDIYLSVGGVTHLDLAGNNLATTKGLEKLKALKEINLSDNFITTFDDLAALSGRFPRLHPSSPLPLARLEGSCFAL